MWPKGLEGEPQPTLGREGLRADLIDEGVGFEEEAAARGATSDRVHLSGKEPSGGSHAAVCCKRSAEAMSRR